MVRLLRKGKKIIFLKSIPRKERKCLQCKQLFDGDNRRRMRDICGHVKCLECVRKTKEQCCQGLCPSKLGAKFKKWVARTKANDSRNPPLPTVPWLKCDQCDIKVTSPTKLKKHIMVSHGEEEVEEEEEEEEEEEMEPRVTRSKVRDDALQAKTKGPSKKTRSKGPSVTIKPLRAMKRKHPIELPWDCNICGEEFLWFSKLQIHKNIMHKQSRRLFPVPF